MSSLPCPECPTCPHYLASIAPRRTLVLTSGLRALWDGVDLDLTHGQFRVLQRLVEAKGDTVTHRQLYDVIKSPGFHAGYGETSVTSNVRSTMRHVRNKFLRVDPGFHAIHSYSGVGYAWRVTP